MDEIRKMQLETEARCRRIDRTLEEALKKITGPRTPEQQREHDEREERFRMEQKGYGRGDD